METVGRGDCRNYYKGHMDNIGGDGGGGGGRSVQLGWREGRGEKAYNCNLITIKNKLRKKIPTMRYHLTAVRVANINKSTNKCWRRCGEK